MRWAYWPSSAYSYLRTGSFSLSYQYSECCFLSGGEAQRVKLASFLGKGKGQGHILFIFDEPTTGLHFHDIKKLLASFNALIEQGHSILVIEHNTDVIKSADWLIDLGPEAGDAGGNMVYAGVPKDLVKVKTKK